MEEFVLQVVTLLGSELSNLFLLIFLAVIISFSVYPSYKQKIDNKIDSIIIKRTIIGLITLLLMQLTLIFFSGLIIWKGFELGDFATNVDYLFSVISLLVIIWLWAFPTPSKAADVTIIILSLTLLLLFLIIIFGENMISIQFVTQNIFPNLVFNAIGLILSLIGLFLLLMLQPNASVYGLIMIGILFLGYLFQLVLLDMSASYPVFFRLTQLAAFPLLFALPVRNKIIIGESKNFTPLTDPVVLNLLRKVSVSMDIRDVCSEIVELFSIITKVLPDPGPAIINKGLFSERTAFF
jgi:hypothetical protein